MITVIDGPDGAGKTELAQLLTKRYGGHRIHHRACLGAKNPAVRYLASMAPWQIGVHGNALERRTLDRSWIAEPIYGRVMRSGQDRVGIARRRMLERVALSLRGVAVLALPTLESCLRVWRRRCEQEYLPDESKMIDVYSDYLNFATEGRCDLPMHVWNYDGGMPSATFIEMFEASRPERNRGPGIGHWAPDQVVLMVGDSPNRTCGRTMQRLPFTDMTERGCSAWLARQLENFTVPESRLYWIDARTRSGKLTSSRFINWLRPLRVVALGEVAASWCREAGLAFYDHVPHPSYWLRCNRCEPYYPLMEVLKDAR